MNEPASKVCAACGRRFSWRRRWARHWDAVRYCSRACRQRGRTADDAALESAVLEIALRRGPRASLCPSEAARQVDADDWRRLMEPARRAARRLAQQGRVQILQGGRAVDPADFRGPVRIRLAAPSDTLPPASRQPIAGRHGED